MAHDVRGGPHPLGPRNRRNVAVDEGVELRVGFMLKRTDGGGTWRLLREGFDCDVHTIVLDPSNSRRVLIATGGGDSRSGRAPGKALYLSEDAGETWIPMAMNFDQTYSVPLAVDPNAPENLFSAVASGPPSRRSNPEYRSITIRSQDAGKSWTAMNVGEELSRDFPEAVVFDDQRPGRVYMGFADSGFFRSDDAGESWERLDLKLDGVNHAKVVHA